VLLEIKMGQKKRSEKMTKIFSCKQFLTSQLNKKIIKLQLRDKKRQAKMAQAHAEHDHDHSGHDHKH
jgi:hypothetical protein